ncbi:hypothetical protein PITCH_A510017 [uncultured Desulfobacterium sp.]|uniref:Uncharacterized protein n=1 Tax=uncultured Desulfobacterium sp. TaxID=201089 RepID=A0A445N0Z8_9BACT|nr:hypothetical protein PITCH_A510017 [uncultured Desulfobacterium sp.]
MTTRKILCLTGQYSGISANLESYGKHLKFDEERH